MFVVRTDTLDDDRKYKVFEHQSGALSYFGRVKAAVEGGDARRCAVFSVDPAVDPYDAKAAIEEGDTARVRLLDATKHLSVSDWLEEQGVDLDEIIRDL